MTGAAYAAPYLGRLAGEGHEALALIGEMQTVIERYGPGTRLLVASVRTREAFRSLIELGVVMVAVSEVTLRAGSTVVKLDPFAGGKDGTDCQ